MHNFHINVEILFFKLMLILMKMNFDLKFIENITKMKQNTIKENVEFFCNLPLQAQVEIFYQMKIIEEDDEYAFFQQNYNKDNVGEYRFSLFLITIERFRNFMQNASKSNYGLSKLKKLNSLKNL